MLGLLHKNSLGLAPKPLQALFSTRVWNLSSYGVGSVPDRHPRQFHDPMEHSHPSIMKRSLFGLVHVYNTLPASTVATGAVKTFQRRLQWQAKDKMKADGAQWKLMYHASV